MNPVETFRQADRAIEGVIAALPDDGWERVPAPVFASDPIGGRPVRDAVDHLARDEAWIPSQLAGETMAEAGEPDVGPFPDLARRARAAADAVTDPAATVHSSFGDQTVEEYLWQLIVARTLGAEALSRTVGLPSPVDDDLAAAVLVGLEPRAELWRQVGILLPARPPASSSARDRLLGLCGV
ncbi:hypothetical protein [Actinomycetospora sp. CA-084318]|uniref:hypothetical protein n=1 Tax=Actinomycetospora sp. CA-084318 TaxID=3239892 RepID=UPI003D97A92F